MKKKLILGLVLLFALTLSACGKKEPSDNAATTAAQTEVTAETILAGAAGAFGNQAAASEAEPAAEAAEDTADEEDEAAADETDAGEEDAEEESGEEEETGDEAGEETGGEDGVEGRKNKKPESDANTLMLAAASNLQFILDQQLLPQFEEQYPDLKVEVVYDSSERLKTQIEKGYNYDLFFCASKKPMSTLIEEGLIMEDSVHFLMSNELVLFIPRTSRLGIAEISDVSKASSIGIGDPADVPVGDYTVEMLKEQELWDVVKEKEVYLSSSVEELIQWVTDGTVDCGFAYKNDVITHLDQLFAVEGFAPTTYRIGILGNTGRLEAATAFTDFLSSSEVLAQFVAYGFTLPET